MADLEFFFDPLCPWAWITSRWATEVSQQRDLDIEWRFISLKLLNEASFIADEAAVAEGREPSLPPAYREASQVGYRLLRVAAALREAQGNDAVAAFYTVCGDFLHTSGASTRMWSGEPLGDIVGEILEAADLPDDIAAAADDSKWDDVIRAETDLAIARAGDDLGTPIITFDTTRPDEATMFGPVINRIPRGDEAVELWDALLTVARTPGIAELKRSLRGMPNFD